MAPRRKPGGLLALFWLVRGYKWLLIVWVLLTWIPGIAGSPFHFWLGVPVTPILNLFSFLQLGIIGLQAIIPLLLLGWLEGLIAKQLGQDAAERHATGTAPPAGAPDPQD